MRRVMLVAAVLLSLPALLFIYQPAMKLGGLGLALGVIGMTISPLILFGALAYLVVKEWW